MSVALSAFLPFVLPHANGCPNMIAQFYVRQAAIEFCRRTLCWSKTLPAVSTVLAPLTFTGALTAATGGTLTGAFTGPTRPDYILTFSDGSTQTVTLNNGSTAVMWLNPVTASASVTYSQVAYAIPPTTDADVIKLLRFTRNGEKETIATPDVGEDLGAYGFQQNAVWLTDKTSFQVVPPPATAGIQYGLKVALVPTQAAASVPDDLFSSYAEDIAAGALARVLGLTDKDWTDKTASAAKRAYFNHRVAIVARAVARGFSRGRHRVVAHTF